MCAAGGQQKPARSKGGMLRAAESREVRVEAGGRSPWAAPPSQSKRLTSFLIQDILRDRAERRGGHAGSPQHQRQSDPRSDPASDPEETGGRGVALADPPNIRSSPTETLAERETGKPNRPGGGCDTLERATPKLMVPTSGCRHAGPMATGRTSPSSAPWASTLRAANNFTIC